MSRRDPSSLESLAHASRRELLETIDALMRKADDLTLKVRQLEDENGNLRRQLKSNSKNSSRPPSSDRYPGQKGKEKQSSDTSVSVDKKRKRGAQPGHRGTQRALVDPDRVDYTVPCHPECCGHCGYALSPETVEGDPIRCQQWDCPPPPPIITEYQRFAHCCPHCERVTRGSLPDGVIDSAFGPNVHAIVGTLVGTCHLSHRQVAGVVRSMHGIPMSDGSVAQIHKRISERLAPVHEEAKRQVEQSDVAHADETGWRIAGQRAWMWLLTNTMLSVFMIQDRRNSEAAKNLLGDFEGVLVTDRCPSYGVYDGKRQWCWAHLIRDFTGMALYTGRAGDLGEELHDHALNLFHHYHRWKDERTKRSTFLQHANSIRRRMTDLLDQGLRSRNPRFSGKCKALYGGWNMAWTFLESPDIPLTNNLAEQSIRPAVILRKISYGNQSHGGREYTERIMTVVASCRKQGRSVLDFMRQVFGVIEEEDGAPSLLPHP